eukprot:1282705-Alexandrium_andersonii.AAC.1
MALHVADQSGRVHPASNDARLTRAAAKDARWNSASRTVRRCGHGVSTMDIGCWCGIQSLRS